MKAIVIYYSLEGNTKYVAETVARHLSADVLRLETAKEYPKGKVSKYIWGGKSVVFGQMPKLLPYQWKKEDYDVVILGTPVWASSFVPPIKTFLKENKISDKKVALFACSVGGDAQKCFQKLEQEAEIKASAILSLKDPKTKESEDNEEKIKQFCEKCFIN